MLPIFIIVWILESMGNADAVALWHWFGAHLIITILLLLFLA